MGDRNRFYVVADFLQQTFPEANRIADIAGGRGLLAIELLFRGYEPTVIEPRRVDRFPRKIRKRLQKLARSEGFLRNVPRVECNVLAADVSSFDLLVGLHPDGATEPIARLAVQHHKPFVIVPCCVMPMGPRAMSFDEWVAYLKSLAPNVKTARLPMDGANLVLYWSP